METTTKKNIENSGSKNNKEERQKRKSAFTLFWEKYPNGAGEIIDSEIKNSEEYTDAEILVYNSMINASGIIAKNI